MGRKQSKTSVKKFPLKHKKSNRKTPKKMFTPSIRYVEKKLCKTEEISAM